MGVAPGTLMHIGRALAGPVRLETHHFGSMEPLERTIVTDVSQAAAQAGGAGILWLDVSGLHDTETIAEIGTAFGLHPLLLEDVVNTHQRPKAEVYGEHLFLVLRVLRGTAQSAAVEAEQLSVVLGRNFVITFQEREQDTFDPVRNRLRDPSSRLRQRGADFLAHALVDTVVDAYFAVLERLGDRLEELENEVMASPESETLGAVYAVRRTLSEVRRAVWPLRDAMAGLGRGDADLIRDETLPYLRDVHDHVIRVIETVETYRDTASTLLELYMSSVSQRLNEVMRVLTIIATLFIPLSFLVGVYGMNFPNMPELGWRWGYAAIWVVMGLVAGGMLLFFRRRGWL
jgi:magnesium transporter